MKKYIFSTPDELKGIIPFAKDGSTAKIINISKVWSVNFRQGKNTVLDGRIGASFYTEGREKKACVFRYGMNDEVCVIGWLKYSTALRWCEEHLTRAD